MAANSMHARQSVATKAVAHFVDCYNGATGQKYTCFRCKRWLPEDKFAFVGAAGRGRKARVVLHGHCFTCREQERGKWINHPLYNPQLDRFMSGLSRSSKASARNRKYVWALEKDDLLGKFIEQGGLCAYSGMEMNYSKSGPTSKTGKHLSAPSIDRIDSSGHYTVDNIHIVMVAVNVMKNELNEDVFLELCRQIAVNKMLS